MITIQSRHPSERVDTEPFVAPGFEAVAAAFNGNFERYGEVGAGSWRLNLASVAPWTLTHRAMANPKIADTYADPQLEMPSGGGAGSVRSIARAYGALATGGSELGRSRRTVDALVAPPVPPSEGTHDLVMQADISWSLGFMRPSHAFPFGTGLRSLGMPGLGG
jgi:hypothetical protein